jgi:uncharacterized protein with GYD domain
MPRYISLCNWTDQGVRNVKQTIERVDAAKQAAGKHGVKIIETLYTIGPYDFVGIFEAPDEESLSRFMLAAASQGNVRSVTMRAFSVDEMKGILSQL